MSQDCDVDFPGTTVANYATACGLPSVANMTLGKNIYFGNGDVFTFGSSVTISGNLVVNAEGSGKIVIPAGVTVDLDGNFQLDSKNSGCALLNPCFFEIEVQGTLIVAGNVVGKLYNLVWSGDGIVIAQSNFEDRACMSCALLGCPEFQVIPAKCKDEGNCLGNFCTAITTCLLDFTKPVITGCPANIISNMTGPGCTEPVTWTPPMASDNCAVTSFVSSHTPGTAFPSGTTIVTYTASDAAGNSTTCTFNVTVVDAIAPGIDNCPANVTVNANASCQAVATWTPPTMTDNCAGGTMTASHSPGSTFPKGTTTVVYTATDEAGNTATCSFNVVVTDDIPPVISNCPSNITINANTSCQAVATWTAPTMSDNCSGGTLTTSHPPGSVFSKGTTTVSYTATDAAGNTATCSFDVTVMDNIPPTIAGCPSNITINANASCQAVATWIAPTLSDNCTGGTLTTTHSPGSTFTKGITTVTYTATDAAGYTATCSFTVTVLDNAAPVIANCPSNITLNANASCQAVATWTAPTMTDNCAGGTISGTHSPGGTFAKGTTTVTYTATDAAGNTSTCSFIVTVVDNNAPVIAGCPSNITINASASCQAVATWTAPTITDNCSGATLSTTHSPGSMFAKGTTTVTYTASDAAGNTATCSFNVTVTDNIPPAITNCPSNITLNANASCQAVATWAPPTMTDNCTGGTLATTHASGSSFPKGTTTVTYTATDAAGNKTTCSFNVTVSDNTAPVISNCPSNITVNANASCQAVPMWTPPTVSDNCAGTTLTSTHTPGSNFPKGVTTVTYTATDAAGSTASCSFNVTVIDNVAPVIANCPSNITANATASCQAVVSWTPPTMPDNCAGGTLTSSHSPGSTFARGTTTVVYTGTDAAGNQSTCSFTVTVVDVSPPVITNCPADITVNANASCQAVVSWTPPTFSDNCSGTSLTSTRSPGSTFAVGTTPVTYTATDAAGRTATCTFRVMVVDATKPVISGCPSNITVNAGASCQAVVSWTPPTVSDNCTGTTMVSTRPPGSTFNVGTTAVTYTATDVNGNISTCTFNVVVQDVTKPVVSGCPANISVGASASCQAVVSWTAPTISDNCAGATLTSSHSSGSTFNVGTTAVTYTATDIAGNKTTCTFNVTVQDAVKPVFSGCPADITVSAAASCQAVVTWTPPTVTDNCTGTSITSTHAPGSTFNLGTTSVSYTATDPAGNSSTCTFQVIVQDNAKPVFSACPADVRISANASCESVASWVAPTWADNCTATVTVTHSPGSAFPVGTTQVAYTATDASGNSSVCTFSVIVDDTTRPVISACPTDIRVVADASCQAVVSWIAPQLEDNCSAQMTTTHNPGSAFDVGTTQVTYTATDAAGNQTSCSFNVIVVAAETAEFTDCPGDIVVEIFKGEPTAVAWTPPVLSAHCSEPEVTSNFKPGDEFPVGTTSVVYTAVTEDGRNLTCSFDITVVFKGIVIHEVVTPNGDGENDTWMIRNIEHFGNNNVIIFDRWGGIVYQAKGYDGTTTAWAGNNVPAGTYFYTLIVKTADTNAEYKGFVELVK